MGFFDVHKNAEWALIEAPIPNAPEAKYISQIPSPTNLLMLSSAIKHTGVKDGIVLFNFLKERHNIPIVNAPNIVYNLGEATCMDYLYNYAIKYLTELQRNNLKSKIYLTGYHAWLHKSEFKNVIHTTPHYFEDDISGVNDHIYEWHNDWNINDWEWMKCNVNSANDGIRVTIRASRGCYHNCRMCPVKLTYQNKVRRYSINWVMQEIDELYNKWQIRQIGFLDDNLFYHRSWGKKLLANMIEKQYKGVKFTFEEGLDVPTALDEELVSLLKEAKFTHVKLGVESFNPKTLEFINKPYKDPDMAIRAIKLLQKYKLNPTCFICIGFPDDTEESISKDINTLSKLGVKLRVQILWPYPGLTFVGKGLDNKTLKQLQQKAMQDTGSCSWHRK